MYTLPSIIIVVLSLKNICIPDCSLHDQGIYQLTHINGAMFLTNDCCEFKLLLNNKVSKLCKALMVCIFDFKKSNLYSNSSFYVRELFMNYRRKKLLAVSKISPILKPIPR